MRHKDSNAALVETLSFDEFWEWLVMHPNCILRAGIQNAVIYDDEDYHWHFSQDGAETYLVQVVRGKRLVGELVVARDRVAYFQGLEGDQEGEVLFEAVGADEVESPLVCFFVMSHGMDVERSEPPHRVH
jgi:hypothetical protein